ncbi:HVA22-like protein a [Canna indica]|uniref:HVA22-like protein n=1 Tax=Canna indica TaxID=4628 RepID=A0AAQ3K016_9LILI|nr:HVA22-like protein a [Canna indica]
MGSGAFLGLITRNFVVLAGPLITLVYPLHASVKAIESKSPVDDQQWLTYWVLYSLLTLFELTFAKLILWLPFWPYAKLIFNCWLVLPHFSGAAYIYEHHVRPVVLNQHRVSVWFVPPEKGKFNKADDILVAAKKYIEQNGPEAFEKLIRKARSASKSKKSSNKRVTFAQEEAGKETKSWKKMNKLLRFGKGGAEKESKPSRATNNILVSSAFDDEMHMQRTSSSSWPNSSFMTFDDVDVVDMRY